MIKRRSTRAVQDQHRWRQTLVSLAKNTLFGKDHGLEKIKSYQDFVQQIPIRDYEALRPYIDKIVAGQADILWPGRPKYFAKTSGTTSGVKYIPLTKESMPNHMLSARHALLNYVGETGDASVFDSKMIFLSGSPTLSDTQGIPTGRLSGIVNHEIPFWLKTNQLPSFETNCIEDWESKLDKIVDETLGQDLRLISGIPPWVQMYYERLLKKTGKRSIIEIFPNFSLFVYGGVNFEPYRSILENLVGANIPSVELYPASEGFIAYQNKQDDKGMLLNTNSGIFFEFVPIDQIHKSHPQRLMLDQVSLDTDYALIINNNAGLWGYNIGDSIRFTSLDPYKIIVSGRVKHFISAFGEHVIGKEVEEALLIPAVQNHIPIVEFTVAPRIHVPPGENPYHEWYIEFGNNDVDIEWLAKQVDSQMCNQNIYYKDLREGNILQNLKIRSLRKNAFRDFMKSNGKLGGQNKVPRLSNDRKIADQLDGYVI